MPTAAGENFGPPDWFPSRASMNAGPVQAGASPNGDIFNGRISRSREPSGRALEDGASLLSNSIYFIDFNAVDEVNPNDWQVKS
ncbi:hypothetical protein [Pedomonas mirosovicensis]|uniref:hypothetical protein n=1 Tax=Pedomonas mirosovicensis TaxID=2908641 RepID=UPI00216923FB|nr:hypothetical protein [Pedomonas mirosovicensis]MCH8686294.1 hypothetical protein [Pedomonas mirosovicensis]